MDGSAPEMAGPGERPASDRRLILCIAIGQLIGWGTLFSAFPLFGAPIEAELGWTRTEFNAGLTLALLVSGLAAVPAGRWVDRRGGRWLLALGGWGGAVLLAAWSQTSSLPVYWAIWVGMGLVQAAALWAPAMAVVVKLAREPVRAITGITFVTGFTATVFVPLTAMLIELWGWRDALLVLAGMQAIPGVLALWLLPPDQPRAAVRDGGSFDLGRAMRTPAFLGLAGALAAHAFIGVGLGAHAIPLLRERGLPEASVIALVSLHGPFQVAARAALFALGRRVTMRGVGRLASALLPVAMLLLAVAPPEFGWLILYILAWAMADGLMTIVRAAGVAEILGREGYGAITGALSAVTVLPRTLAPVLIALISEGAGGYGPVPWLLAGLGACGAACFALAAAQRSR
ncbi:MFS transporter [Belnapia rosea]|uniref:MFS transporter n=1 Tax=Belnapia rosea TaxID=938405 RepID=UPI0008822C5B|nr:MFS transporter [Belnapia rosea]SDB12964.1 Predicted arabinose efflux permease, MFS family [Belnapia rosea]